MGGDSPPIFYGLTHATYIKASDHHYHQARKKRRKEAGGNSGNDDDIRSKYLIFILAILLMVITGANATNNYPILVGIHEASFNTLSSSLRMDIKQHTRQ